MATEKPSVHPNMVQHFQELMSNVEIYGWEPVRAFHALWLQQLEHSRVTWANEDINLRYKQVLVGLLAAGSLQTAPARKQVYNVPAKLESRACESLWDVQWHLHRLALAQTLPPTTRS